MWKFIKWCLGIVFVLYVIGSLIPNSSKNTKPTNTATNVGVEKKEPEKPVAAPKPGPTSAEVLAEAKKEFAKDKANWAGVNNLYGIKEGEKEYPEAQKILNQVKIHSKIKAEKEQAEEERRTATARKDYAKELEFKFLDKMHMDTTITVSGKNNTIIKIKWILWTRVTVYEFFKDGKILSTWRSMGFKKYILTDGYRWTWTDNL
jgi:hypothetical protein